MARKPFMRSLRTATRLAAGTSLVLAIAFSTGCNTTGTAPSPFAPYNATGKAPGGAPTPINSPTARSQPMPPPNFPAAGSSNANPMRIGNPAAPANTGGSARLKPFDPSTGAPMSGSPSMGVPGATAMSPTMTSLPTSNSMNPNFPAVSPPGVRMPDVNMPTRPIASTSTQPPSMNAPQFPVVSMPQIPNPASTFGAPTGPNAPNLGSSGGPSTTYSTAPAVQ